MLPERGRPPFPDEEKRTEVLRVRLKKRDIDALYSLARARRSTAARLVYDLILAELAVAPERSA